MRMEVLHVSPEIATDARNTGNRPLSKAAVQRLVGRMDRGEWQLTHQGIAFDEDGVLIDGQHRLAAIAKAGISVSLTVTHGVPRTAFTVMDTGRKRTGRDALALTGEANATHLAAALRGLHLYLNAPNSSWSGGSSVTSNDQPLTMLDEHPGFRDALQHGVALNRACRITVTATAIGWYVTCEARARHRSKHLEGGHRDRRTSGAGRSPSHLAQHDAQSRHGHVAPSPRRLARAPAPLPQSLERVGRGPVDQAAAPLPQRDDAPNLQAGGGSSHSQGHCLTVGGPKLLTVD
ncbi:hypothetical protein [Streptomyces edwardsiae]|uniref:ParB/Sulfiredoxin domain-containing protein n=1 Tax=Streptomyces edwardsiae TaxID=3075527 RepID=A0ABU2QB08_9ACTN|nr:hypothetical protein [Streptomyces sp. DSM 41635]MDT0401133.1 hypothetical protein [Streptomyces sp. DSM 41635]